MTQEVKDRITNEVLKGGLAFIVMVVVIYFLYKDNQNNTNDIKKEVAYLRAETKDCTMSYQSLLLNQLEKSNKTLEKNNEIVEVYFKQGKRRVYEDKR